MIRKPIRHLIDFRSSVVLMAFAVLFAPIGARAQDDQPVLKSNKDSERNWSGAVQCNNAIEAENSVVNVSAQFAQNSIGVVGQDIFAISGSYADCVNARARLQLVGSYAEVRTGGFPSRQAIVGVGYQYEAAPWLTVAPLVSAGFEEFDRDPARLVLSGGVLFEGIRRLGGQGANEIFLTFSDRPEYTSRRVASPGAPGRTTTSNSFSNTAVLGVDFRPSPIFRANAAVVSQYIGNNEPISSITSLKVNARFNERRDPGRYHWSVEAWYGRGSGDYQTALLTLSYRFGFGGRNEGPLVSGRLDGPKSD